MGKLEKKLQASIVFSFGQYRPNERGLLWSTRNITLSQVDGATQVALGMIKGVADLLYYRAGHLVGIEVKAPGEPHKWEHIVTQKEWGEKITNQGGSYFIVTSLAGFWHVILNYGEGYHVDVYTLERINEKLDEKRSVIAF